MFDRLRRRREGSEPVTVAVNGGLLSARLRDEKGRPLAGATGVLRNTRTQRVTQAASDEFGLLVATLAPGSYTVTVNAGGYRAETRTIEVVSGDHAALGVLDLTPDAELQLPAPGEWVLDPDHSSIQFVARHIALSQVYGRFTKFNGRIHVGERPQDSYVEVLIDAASIDTASPKRDAHLRSADFLDVQRFPHLHFVSDHFGAGTGDKWHVTGDLTIRGSTRGVRLETSYLGLQPWSGTRFGAVAKTELHREDFAINWQQTLAKGVVVVGTTVEVRLNIQAVQRRRPLGS
jgi:polyisoprenoid-binding protein YceI